jgi:serine/threonine protein phosphatase PrpC
VTVHQPVGSTWSIGGASARGAAHVRKRLPNQDAIAWAPASGSGEAVVIAVSDGHGSDSHFRSDTGARLAVESAIAVLGDFLVKNKGADPSRINTAAIELPARIHEAWRSKVNADLQRAPLPEPRPSDPEARFVPYGATIVAAAATADFVLVLQLGDGDLLVGFSDGQIVRPLPDDTGLVGEQTYSLCNADAARANRFRLQVLPRAGRNPQPQFLMLSTDGLSKSCADEEAFAKLAREWRDVIQKDGLASLAGSLEPWLVQASQRGSGDDVTLGFAVMNTSQKAPRAEPRPAAAADPRLERRVQLAALLSYLSIALSVLALLAVGVLWWTSGMSQPPPAKKAPVSRQPAAPAPAPRAPPAPAPAQEDNPPPQRQTLPETPADQPSGKPE